MPFRDINKYKYTVQIGSEDYTFTELSIRDDLEIEARYSKYDGDIVELLGRTDISIMEAITFILTLMLKEEHPDITEDDVKGIPKRMLPDLYQEVFEGLFGQMTEVDGESKKKE